MTWPVTTCPRCGRRLITKRDESGIVVMQWKVCPALKACGWTVFNHGQDPRDKEGEQ